MRFLPLIWKNLTRKKLRFALTLGSFVVAFFLFGLLAIIDLAFNQGVELAGADRLITRNKISLIMPLPYSYRERLLQVPGVTAVTFASWFGGVYQDPKNFFPQFAIDPEEYPALFPEYRVAPEQWQAFLQDREGCVVGRALAERFGWELGDRIPIRGTIWPGSWEFNVRAIYEGARPQDDLTQFWFQHDYLEERREYMKGVVGWYTVKVGDPEQAAAVAAAIDERFANSPFETATETEKAFATGFAKQVGNIRLLLTSIGAVVFFTLLLVTGNTMAMSIRERTGELAVLKTVGFTDGRVLGLVLCESLLFAVVGGVGGLALAKLFSLGGDPTGGMLPAFHLAPGRLGLGLGLAAATGLLAGAVPALLAMRLRIVDALRRV